MKKEEKARLNGIPANIEFYLTQKSKLSKLQRKIITYSEIRLTRYQMLKYFTFTLNY